MAQYSFGWRPSPPDFRDQLYHAPRHIMEALPPSIDLTVPTLPAPYEPPFNQGNLGSCGPNSLAGDIVFAAFRQQKLASCPMPSRLFIYYNARVLMGTVNEDSGVYNRDLMKAIAQYGWCDESLWPYDVAKFRVKPPAAAYDQASKRKISQYLSVAQDLNTIKSCLAGGDTFIFGFSVYSSMLTSQVDQTGDIPMPSNRDSLEGGHDVDIVGYDDATQKFKIRNSWGNWGKNGYGTIPYAYALNPRLSGDFWTARHAGLPDDPTPPVPPIPPTPSGKKTFSFSYDPETNTTSPVTIS